MQISAEGLRVLVTAGASGIGQSIAELFDENGARVEVCDIDESALERLALARPGIGVGRCDVGDRRQVDAFVDDIVARLGGLDVLINNAGIAGATAAVEELDPDDWDRTLAVNLSGQFYCIRRVVPGMKEAGGGVIINISSTSGVTGLPLRVAYAVSKHAVLGLTRTLARELGPAGIRVNAILPGWVNNERGRRVLEEKADALGVPAQTLVAEMAEFISLRTMVEPAEIATMALFLCSPAGRHVSGQFIGVCGNVEYER